MHNKALTFVKVTKRNITNVGYIAYQLFLHKLRWYVL